jgi:hypothetical protein
MMTKALEKMDPVPLLKMDAEANKAARAVNDEHIKNTKDIPQPGGNVVKLQEVVGEGKVAEATEYTMIQWNGSAMDLVLLCLLSQWEKEGKSAGVINIETSTLGLSFKAHKKCQNLF